MAYKSNATFLSMDSASCFTSADIYKIMIGESDKALSLCNLYLFS